MRQVLYREYSRYRNEYSDYIYKGFFHQWVVKPRKNFDSETYAIIETERGFVEEISIENIKFVNKK